MDDISLKLGDQLAQEKEDAGREICRNLAAAYSPKPVSIELSVKASDGSFDAVLAFPVSSTREQINACFEGWIKMIRAALEIYQEQEKRAKTPD